MQQDPSRQIQIRASDADLKGAYSNMMQVSHTQEEFILDYFYLTPNAPVGTLASRVILSPGHFKRMVEVLGVNLKNYEKLYGQITAAQGPNQEIGFKT